MAKKFVRKFNSKNPVPVSYVKSFDSFEDGYQEVINLNPELINYLGINNEYNAVVQHILKIVSTSVPSVNNPNYPNTVSLSIDSNEVGFKTDANVAIGWRTGFNYKSGNQYFNFRLSYIGLPSYKMGIFSTLEENEWKKIEGDNKQSRFWNKVDDKRPAKNSAPKVESNEVSTFEVNTAAVKEETPVAEEVVVEEKKEPVVIEEDPNVKVPEKNFPVTKEEAMETAIKNGFLNDATVNSFEWYDEANDKYVDISKEEVFNYANRNINSINRCAVDNKFSVTYHGKSSIIDITNPENNPDNVIINPANNSITIEEVTYDYKTLKVYKN